jgi:hypothetical protein
MKWIVPTLAVGVCMLTVCLVATTLDRPAQADPLAACNCPTWCPRFCPPGTECVCGGTCGCCECSAPYSPAGPEAPEPASLPTTDDAVENGGTQCSSAIDPEAGRPGRPCKPCKDRPWCECSYNGHPRISCDPCCYDAQPYPICFD